jgi:predicted amidohydrolase YtcJ
MSAKGTNDMERVILSAKIFTGDPQNPWAAALGIKDGKIAAVGEDREIRGLCSKRTKILDLPGRLMVPGLVDGHVHFCSFGQSLSLVSLKNLSSLVQCRERIRSALSGYRPGEWVFGRGWDQRKWQEGREPTRRDLDDLAPDNPLIMFRADGHTVWANSLALEKAGVTKASADPPGVKIERDPGSGEPTGILREAIFLFRKFLPRNSREELKAAALAAQQEALKFGLTGVHSCEMLPQFEALAELEKEGRLKLRVYHLPRPQEIADLLSRDIRPGTAGPRLWAGHMKLFADGSLGSGTALLHQPYQDDPSNYGLTGLTQEALRDQITRAYDWGGEAAIHAIGDRAVSNSLAAIAEARKIKGIRSGEKRDRLEHVQLFRSADLSLFHGLGVTASVQPVFTSTDWTLAEEKWGRDRCRGQAYAWKTLEKAGIPLLFGSDAPFDDIDPLLGLQAAVNRQTPQGQPAGGWFPEERLSLEQGLKAFTLIPAWTSHRETMLGSISPGKQADLTVFQENLFEIPPESWPSVKVEMTIVDGEIVYQR